MSRRKRRRSQQRRIFILAGIVAAIFLAGTVYMVKSFLLTDLTKKKRQIHMLRLVEPPPPPPPKEKERPPEPEMKKEEIKQPEQKKEVTEDRPQEGPKPGSQLGLDTEGSGGSDAFGLVAKKGGAPLIGGGGGNQWGWYTRLVQDEIQRELERVLQENGGIPKGRFQLNVKVTLDERGRIVSHLVYTPSGNEILEKALDEALRRIRLKEGPPEGMPKNLKLKVSTQG